MTKKKPRVSYVDQYSRRKPRSALALKFHPIIYLENVLKQTRQNILMSQSKAEVFDALCNMDTELKHFRDNVYPYVDVKKRIYYEEIIRDLVRKLEGLARKRLRSLVDNILMW